MSVDNVQWLESLRREIAWRLRVRTTRWPKGTCKSVLSLDEQVVIDGRVHHPDYNNEIEPIACVGG
jgi:hypothetical protein